MRSPIAATLALLLAAVPAAAVELIPGWDVDGVWDSNVLRENLGKEDADYSVRTGPDLTVRERQGDFTYDALGQVRYENFARLDSLDTNGGPSDLDYYFLGSGTWVATDRTRLSFNEAFTHTNSLTSIFDNNPTDVSQISAFTPGRTLITTNSASGVLAHRLGRLWETTATVQHTMNNYDDEFQSDTADITGVWQLTRGITPRLVLGAGAQVNRQEFEPAEGDGSGTNFYQGFAVLQYSFSPTFRISLNAGPALSAPDDPGNEVETINYRPVLVGTCPIAADGARIFNPRLTNGGCARALWRNAADRVAITPGAAPAAPLQELAAVPFLGEGPQGALSYFGRISLDKDWRNWTASAGISRNASSSSGLGGSSILTAFNTSLRYQPSQRWTFTANGTWTQQVAANELSEQLIVLASDSTIVGDQLFETVAVGGGFAAVPCSTPSATCRLYDADPVGVPTELRTGEKIDNAVNLQTWRIEFRAQRQMSRNLTLEGSASYFRQKSESDISAEREAQIVRVIFGMTWKFDPIML